MCTQALVKQKIRDCISCFQQTVAIVRFNIRNKLFLIQVKWNLGVLISLLSLNHRMGYWIRRVQVHTYSDTHGYCIHPGVLSPLYTVRRQSKVQYIPSDVASCRHHTWRYKRPMPTSRSTSHQLNITAKYEIIQENLPWHVTDARYPNKTFTQPLKYFSYYSSVCFNQNRTNDVMSVERK